VLLVVLEETAADPFVVVLLVVFAVDVDVPEEVELFVVLVETEPVAEVLLVLLEVAFEILVLE